MRVPIDVLFYYFRKLVRYSAHGPTNPLFTGCVVNRQWGYCEYSVTRLVSLSHGVNINVINVVAPIFGINEPTNSDQRIALPPCQWRESHAVLRLYWFVRQFAGCLVRQLARVLGSVPDQPRVFVIRINT
jgi:hypothetical protein